MAARPLAVLLDRRTRHRSIRAEHAAIARLRLEFLAAALADIEKLTGIEWHPLASLEAAFRASQDRFQLHGAFHSAG
jgi:hypothetical protein